MNEPILTHCYQLKFIFCIKVTSVLYSSMGFDKYKMSVLTMTVSYRIFLELQLLVLLPPPAHHPTEETTDLLAFL